MVMYLLLGLAAGAIIIVWIKLRMVFKLFRVTMPSVNQNDLDALPSVSLCIPARDEMHAMTECLESALSSSYPKLEIIVLDDGSRDNTGHLIKSFAHSGVRFVEGSPLPDGWLGKNHALDGLLRESSGSLILFSDVDTRFTPDTIGHMVAYMQQQDADMISVLPYRQDTMRSSAIFATFRHFWSIIGHTRAHPAVASSAWMIKRSTIIDELHGFSGVALNVRPEKAFAQEVFRRNGYRFVISSKNLGMSYEKKLSSQYETSYRVYYPDFGIKGILVRIMGLVVCIVPYLIVAVGIIRGDARLALTAFALTIGISIVNAWYLGVLRSNNYGITSICLPFIMVREIYLLVASVVMYKTNSIKWKGRPVSIRQ